MKLLRYIYVTTEQAGQSDALLNRSKCLTFCIIAIGLILNVANWFIYWLTMPWEETVYVQACLSPNHNTEKSLFQHLSLSTGIIFYGNKCQRNPYQNNYRCFGLGMSLLMFLIIFTNSIKLTAIKYLPCHHGRNLCHTLLLFVWGRNWV